MRVLLLTIALLAGCASNFTERTTPLSAAGSKVQVHNQMSTLVSSCRKIGPVTGIARASWYVPNADAKNDARGQVAAMGGDTLVVTNIDQMTYMAGYETTLHGIAMSCY